MYVHLLSTYRSILTPTTIHLPRYHALLCADRRPERGGTCTRLRLINSAFALQYHPPTDRLRHMISVPSIFSLTLFFFFYSSSALFCFCVFFPGLRCTVKTLKPSYHSTSSSLTETHAHTAASCLRAPVCTCVYSRQLIYFRFVRHLAFRPVMFSGYCLGFRNSGHPPISPCPAEVYTLRNSGAVPVAASLRPRCPHRICS
jgi:hypothetical protein